MFFSCEAVSAAGFRRARGAAFLGVAAPAMFIVKCGDSRSSQKFEKSR